MADNRYTGVGYEPPFETPSDKDFMAAHIEELESRVRELEAQYADSCSESDSMLSDIRELEAERDRLKAEIERQKRLDLSGECDRLRSRHAALVEAAKDYEYLLSDILTSRKVSIGSIQSHFSVHLGVEEITKFHSKLKAALAEVKK
jgi:chromosome segregation ATPase